MTLLSAPILASDPTRCPLCGAPNRCAMEVERASGAPQPPCWCMRQAFSPASLDQVPAAARGTACVCAACAARGNALS